MSKTKIDTVLKEDACPRCKEDRVDNLVWEMRGKNKDRVRCASCGKFYTPSTKRSRFAVQHEFDTEPTYVVDKSSTVFHSDGDIRVVFDSSLPVEIRLPLAKKIATLLNGKDKKGQITNK